MIFLKELGEKLRRNRRRHFHTFSREFRSPYSVATLLQCWAPLVLGTLMNIEFYCCYLLFNLNNMLLLLLYYYYYKYYKGNYYIMLHNGNKME